MTDDTQGIVVAASQAVGHRVSRKAIVRFIVKWGWEVAAAAFNLAAQDLMALFVREKSRPHRHYGPHLYTVLKRIKRGEHYKKMLARYASKAHVHHATSYHRHRGGGFRVPLWRS